MTRVAPAHHAGTVDPRSDRNGHVSFSEDRLAHPGVGVRDVVAAVSFANAAASGPQPLMLGLECEWGHNHEYAAYHLARLAGAAFTRVAIDDLTGGGRGAPVSISKLASTVAQYAVMSAMRARSRRVMVYLEGLDSLELWGERTRILEALRYAVESYAPQAGNADRSTGAPIEVNAVCSIGRFDRLAPIVAAEVLPIRTSRVALDDALAAMDSDARAALLGRELRIDPACRDRASLWGARWACVTDALRALRNLAMRHAGAGVVDTAMLGDMTARAPATRGPTARRGVVRVDVLGTEADRAGSQTLEFEATPGNGSIVTTFGTGPSLHHAVDLARCVLRRALALDTTDIFINARRHDYTIDGRSCMLAVVLGIAAALREGVSERRVAATGEVDLAGGVLPIDHLWPKLAAAAVNGVERVFCPAEQRDEAQSFVDRFEHVLAVVPVRSVDEAIAAWPSSAGRSAAPGGSRE